MKMLKEKKRNIIIAISCVVVLVVFTVIVCIRLFSGFNASKYVNAVCAQVIMGDVEDAVQVTRGLTEEAAKEQHEVMVSNFVDNVIASGLTLDEKQKEECVEISKKIFSEMKYDVKKSKKISDDEYHVTIEYQKTDVIEKLQKLAKEESERANKKVSKGEYRGTAEEIKAQLQEEFTKKLPDMLEEAYKTMKFGKTETMVLVVKKSENGLYTVDVGQFIEKIMNLSTKED